MKATLRFITFLIVLSVCLADRAHIGIKTRTHTKHRNKRRETSGAPGEGDAAAGGAAPAGPPIKLDNLNIFIPETPPSMAKKPQLVIQRDGVINPSEKSHEQLLAREPCKLQQGYVLLQKKIDTKSAVPILTVKPAFAVLNPQSISFFDGENVHTLIDSFPLKSVQVGSDQLWIQSNCIALHKCVQKKGSGSKGPVVGQKPEKIFCVESKQLADEWSQAVDEFHRCTLEVLGESEDSTNKLKSKIKRAGMESEEQIEERRKKQLLETEQQAGDQEATEREDEKKQMDQMMKKIMEQYREHKEIERKRREQLRLQRQKMREKNKRLGSLARCVESALEVKAMQDQMTLDSLLKETKSLHENNLLRDAQSKMEALWQKGDNDITQQENDLRKAQAEVYQKMKGELIQEAADWTKDLDPIDCYRDTLSGGNLMEMKKVCANTVDYGAVPDLKKLLTCLDKKGFCNICCSYYIGAAKESDKVRCIKQCDTIINGDSNAYLIKYGIGIKKLPIEPPTNGVETKMYNEKRR